MEDNPAIHPAVTLLVHRMESHPEEFVSGDRWDALMDKLNDHLSEEGKTALWTRYNELKLDDLHKQVMDELLNGPEKREQQKTAQEAERVSLAKLARQVSKAKLTQQAQQVYLQGSDGSGYAQSQLNVLQSTGYPTGTPTWTSNSSSTGTTADASALDKIKKVLGI